MVRVTERSAAFEDGGGPWGQGVWGLQGLERARECSPVQHLDLRNRKIINLCCFTN